MSVSDMRGLAPTLCAPSCAAPSGIAQQPLAIVAVAVSDIGVDAGVRLVPVRALALDDEMLGQDATPLAAHLDLRARRGFPHLVVVEDAAIFVIASVAGLPARPALVLVMAARVVVLRQGRIGQHAEEERAETDGDPAKRGTAAGMVGTSRPTARQTQAVESRRQEGIDVQGKSNRSDLSDSFLPARQGCDEAFDRVHPWNCGVCDPWLRPSRPAASRRDDPG